MQFSKMHGLGNDFMVVDAVTQNVYFSPELIRRLADRRIEAVRAQEAEARRGRLAAAEDMSLAAQCAEQAFRHRKAAALWAEAASIVAHDPAEAWRHQRSRARV